MTIIKKQSVQFIVMVIIGMLFNPMNVLAFRVKDIYPSLTLFYGGLLMASNMIWSHEIIHYLHMKQFNNCVFLSGVILSIFIGFLLQKQLFVTDNEWLKRMIGHHSTALTTSHIIHNKTKNKKIKKLSHDIINAQEKEIALMKSWL
jgi:hypothetical protein